MAITSSLTSSDEVGSPHSIFLSPSSIPYYHLFKRVTDSSNYHPSLLRLILLTQVYSHSFLKQHKAHFVSEAQHRTPTTLNSLDIARSCYEAYNAAMGRPIAYNGGSGQFATANSTLWKKEQINEEWNKAMANKTQATFLPMGGIYFHFPAFDMKLTGDENWIEWERNVRISSKVNPLTA